MKQLSFGSPGAGQQAFQQWAQQAFQTIEQATSEDVEATLSEFSYTGTLTEARTFNAGTATVTEIRNVLATMISDIKKRGQKRSYAT